ncbi:MAG: glycosyltransferase [Alphaproteobacteria bacterium]|nr:glycosyltransferase [Alphaproteobacteria bacterium]
MAQALTVSRPEERSGAPTPQPIPAARHVLHVLPGFGVGGIQVRLARIVNALGPRFRHTILSLSGDTNCRDRFDPALDVVVERAVPRGGLVARLDADVRRIRATAPDLLATYNWGAIEWAMANRLLAGARHCHFEDGFGPDEAEQPLRRRGVLRRLALKHAEAIVVPSRTLESIAIARWRLPASRVTYLPNGIDTRAFRAPLVGVPLFPRRSGEIVIGTVAPLRPEKNLARLLGAVARLDDQSVRLAIAGDGGERLALEALARRLGIAERVLFLGEVREPQRALALFDVFALSSDTEQMPMTVLEAMATGLPIAAVDVGDVKHMVAPANRTFIVPRGEVTLATALAALVADAGRRHALGSLNRAHVDNTFPFARMVEAYARLFEGRP